MLVCCNIQFSWFEENETTHRGTSRLNAVGHTTVKTRLRVRRSPRRTHRKLKGSLSVTAGRRGRARADGGSIPTTP